MKNLSLVLLATVLFFVTPAVGQEGSPSSKAPDSPPELLQPGKWWNLYFDEGNDPLNRPVRAVKVLQLSERHASWVRITFPEDRDEHFSIYRPAAKAHDDDAVDLDAALAEWEKRVTQWKTMWINLNFVVQITKVEQSDEREPE